MPGHTLPLWEMQGRPPPLPETEGSEVEGGSGVADCRDKDDVALIALHVFEILHEEGLKCAVPMLAVRLYFGIGCGHLVHQSLPAFLLEFGCARRVAPYSAKRSPFKPP